MVVELEALEEPHGDKNTGGEYYGEDEVYHELRKITTICETDDKRTKK